MKEEEEEEGRRAMGRWKGMRLRSFEVGSDSTKSFGFVADYEGSFGFCEGRFFDDVRGIIMVLWSLREN